MQTLRVDWVTTLHFFLQKFRHKVWHCSRSDGNKWLLNTTTTHTPTQHPHPTLKGFSPHYLVGRREQNLISKSQVFPTWMLWFFFQIWFSWINENLHKRMKTRMTLCKRVGGGLGETHHFVLSEKDDKFVRKRGSWAYVILYDVGHRMNEPSVWSQSKPSLSIITTFICHSYLATLALGPFFIITSFSATLALW